MTEEIVRFEEHVVKDRERFYASIIRYLAWLELKSQHCCSRGRIKVKYRPLIQRDGEVVETGETKEIEIEDVDPTWIYRVTAQELETTIQKIRDKLAINL